MGRGFASPTWMTFKQALERGGAVRKGEKGSSVVYASTLKGRAPAWRVSPSASCAMRSPWPASDDETAIEAHSHERLSHLAEQVIINSRITMRKLKFFSFAVTNLFVGAFLAVATALVIIAMRSYGTALAFG